MATYGHTPIAISSHHGECMRNSTAGSTTFNANFILQIAYGTLCQSIQVMITMEGPRQTIDLLTLPHKTVGGHLHAWTWCVFVNRKPACVTVNNTGMNFCMSPLTNAITVCIKNPNKIHTLVSKY